MKTSCLIFQMYLKDNLIKIFVNLSYLKNYFTNYLYFKILCIGKESHEKDFHKNLSYIKPFFFLKYIKPSETK